MLCSFCGTTLNSGRYVDERFVVVRGRLGSVAEVVEVQGKYGEIDGRHYGTLQLAIGG